MPRWLPLCTEPNHCSHCRCPSDSFSDRAIHTVPIMSNHRQVHIGSEPSRTDTNQLNLSPLSYATFSLISHEGYQECPSALRSLLRLDPPVRLRAEAQRCAGKAAPKGVGEGRTPTRPLHTLGHHLRVEQCAVLLYPWIAGLPSPGFPPAYPQH